MFIFSMRLS